MYRVDAKSRDRLLARLEAALNGRSDLVFGVVSGSFLEDGGFRDIDVGIWTTGSDYDRVFDLLETDLDDRVWSLDEIVGLLDAEPARTAA